MKNQDYLNIYILSRNNFVKEILEQIFLQEQICTIQSDSELISDLRKCKNSIVLSDKIIENTILHEFLPIIEIGNKQQNREAVFIKEPFKYTELQGKMNQALAAAKSDRRYLAINNKVFVLLNKKRAVYVDGRRCLTADLTEKEVELLKFIYSQPDMRASKSSIQQNVFGYSSEIDSHTVETHIYRIRNKETWLRDLVIFEGFNNYSLSQGQ